MIQSTTLSQNTYVVDDSDIAACMPELSALSMNRCTGLAASSCEHTGAGRDTARRNEQTGLNETGITPAAQGAR